MISIAGLEKADVLAALYNASRPQGMGFMHYTPEAMSSKEAAEILADGDYFDYLKGRVMKISLSGSEFNERVYDRDNGTGAAAAAINAVRNGMVNAPELQEMHAKGREEAAAIAVESMSTKSSFESSGIFSLGLADVTDELMPKVAGYIDGDRTI